MAFSAEFLAVVGGLVAGAIGGFIYSLVGWFKDNEAFDTKKNLSAVMLGILGGVSLAILQADTFAQIHSDYQLLVAYVTLIISGSGVAALVPRAVQAASKPSDSTPVNTTTTTSTTTTVIPATIPTATSTPASTPATTPTA